MATIADTLNEIEKIQEEFKIIGNDESLIKELMSFTTVFYFEYLSHAVLDNSRHIDLSGVKGATKYYELFANETVLSEHVRSNNIGQLSLVWNAYEKYLRKKYFEDFNLKEFKIKKLFDDLIDKINPANKTRILEEFEVIRNTRNSLHDGGIYSSDFAYFKGELNGNEYEFHPGAPVKPLRIMDVIKAIWSHYKDLEQIGGD